MNVGNFCGCTTFGLLVVVVCVCGYWGRRIFPRPYPTMSVTGLTLMLGSAFVLDITFS